jgi:hypothetical protein
MNRLYLDETNNRFVLLSYAGGTKYFRHLTETKLSGYTPVNGRSLAPIQLTYSVIQIVRDPLARYMSWFDKQYIKPMYRRHYNNFEFKEWINNLITKEWIDNYFKLARASIHYDGHTNFQSVWPKMHLPALYNDSPNWQYLKMEDIRPFFLNEKSFDPFRDPKEYVGVWDLLDSNIKEYFINVIKDTYNYEIQWYNNLEFICPK